jgi:hypothetical protein
MDWLLAQKGKPYVWGSKGNRHVIGGTIAIECYDCSGLVTKGLVELGHPRACRICKLDLCGFHNAQRLFDELEPVSVPAAMDLVFYGSGVRHVSHVMVWWGDNRVFGASGGNRDSIEAAVSLRRGQKVKFQATRDYRPDFLGFRRLPL